MQYLFAILFVAAPLLADEVKETIAEKEVKRLAVPEKLTPPGKIPLFLLRAEGVQVYRAEKKGDELVWTFQEPDAALLDFKTGEKVGTHGNGPVWVDLAGGKVRAQVTANHPAPSAGAVPWLLLEVKGEPTGRFQKVTHIQRLDTWAGQAPATKPKMEAETIKCRYHATYVFWGER